MNKIALLLAFLTLIGYLISQNYASFYMLKGFQNALYLNVSPQSFVLQYPINSIANTTINVYATYIPSSYFGNALNYGYIQFSGINGSTFLGNLSFIPYKDGFLIPKYTLLGNTYKTLALYYNGTKPAFTGYYSKTYTDTLQNNYEFVYYSFYNYNLTKTQAETIPAQPNNNTNTGGTFQISFDNLPIPYFLIASPYGIDYYNLTYYRATGIIARQIIALHKFFNTSISLIGNGKAFTQNIINTNYNGGLLLNPNGKIWLGYLNMPLYYYNYNITNASTINNVPPGLYYSNYNYILNIQMPNTQQVYSSPSYFYYLIPAYAQANIISQAAQQQNITNLPNFEYQFNLTNINWTMRITDWLNWSGGYNMRNFNILNATQNPSFHTSYLMFSLPAYPCLLSANGQYGNIQAYGYQGSTNLGRIPISQFQKQGNTIYYVMPNLTTKGLSYSNAVVYICSPNSNSPSQLSQSNFVIATYSGSGNAIAKTYSTSSINLNAIAFINPTLFYGNESINLYASSSGGPSYPYSLYIYPQEIYFNEEGNIYSLNQLANNKIYIIYYVNNEGLSEIWGNNEALVLNNGYGTFYMFNQSTNIYAGRMFYGPSNQQFNLNLPYNATATIVNYFTTKYTQGQLEPVTTTSSSSSSGVSNPVILPSSPKLNLSITNTTLTNNLNNLKQEFSKNVVLYGMNIPLGLIYIIDLFLIIALAIFSKHEGAFIIALAIFWFSGLLFIQQLVIAAIITIAYATYRLEGIFHKESG